MAKFSPLLELSDMTRTPPGVKESWVRSNANHEGDECLDYPFARDIYGYPGGIQKNYRQIKPNRLMCELVNGPPPSPVYVVAHSCGKGHLGCINPKHLSWKTPKENSADMVQHGTSPVGQKNGCAKLTDAEAGEIKTLLKQRMRQRDIAKIYGVSQAVINYINVGRNWSHVEAV